MDENIGQIDVIIVGAGPAGIAAAIWCDDLKLRACIVEKASDVGGQLHWIYNAIENYPGARFANGSEAVRKFRKSLAGRQINKVTDASVVDLDVNVPCVVLGDGKSIVGRSIIFATGIRRRKLDIRGEIEFLRKGLIESGSRDRVETSGKKVAVIGGGDAALENALILADYAERVYLVHRRDHFSARAEFVRSVSEHARIEPIMGARVREFGGSENLEFIDLERGNAGSQRVAVEKAVVRIGVQPNSELLVGKASMDDAGYILVDRVGQTSVPNLYAVGDVAFRESPTIATAVGSAIAAVKSIAADIRIIEWRSASRTSQTKILKSLQN